MSSDYGVFETEAFGKSIKKLKLQNFAARLRKSIYPQLQKSPHVGPNIKKLKGEFSFAYRYRIGRYRIIYVIDDEEKTVYLTNIQHRRDVYR